MTWYPNPLWPWPLVGAGGAAELTPHLAPAQVPPPSWPEALPPYYLAPGTLPEPGPALGQGPPPAFFAPPPAFFAPPGALSPAPPPVSPADLRTPPPGSSAAMPPPLLTTPPVMRLPAVAFVSPGAAQTPARPHPSQPAPLSPRPEPTLPPPSVDMAARIELAREGLSWEEWEGIPKQAQRFVLVQLEYALLAQQWRLIQRIEALLGALDPNVLPPPRPPSPPLPHNLPTAGRQASRPPVDHDPARRHVPGPELEGGRSEAPSQHAERQPPSAHPPPGYPTPEAFAAERARIEAEIRSRRSPQASPPGPLPPPEATGAGKAPSAGMAADPPVADAPAETPGIQAHSTHEAPSQTSRPAER